MRSDTGKSRVQRKIVTRGTTGSQFYIAICGLLLQNRFNNPPVRTRVRCFVAVDASPVANGISTVQDRFRGVDGIRLTDPAQAHITLAFLGEIDPADVETVETAIGRGVSSADIGPFDCRLADLGVFPDPESISVIWLGVARGDEELTALHEGGLASLRDAGIEPDVHDRFVPHVTLGRVSTAEAGRAVRDALDESPQTDRFRVSRVHLVESQLDPDGPRYTTGSTWSV